MAIFKIAIKYQGVSAEEIVEFEAPTPSVAKKKCEEVMNENKDFVERLNRHGIYTSKVAQSCSLCPYDFRFDFLGCDLVLNLIALKEGQDSEHDI
mgnify:CR=1 FL=1